MIITLGWDVVAGADGYRIHAGLAPGIYTEATNITPGSATGGAITLPSAGTWYLCVAAYVVTEDYPNGIEGPYSGEITHVLTGAPEGLITLAVGS